MLQKTFEIHAGDPHRQLLNIELGNTYLALNSFDGSGLPAAQFELFNFGAEDNWAELWSALPSQSKILDGSRHSDSFENVRVTWENDLVQAIPNVFWRPELTEEYGRYNKGSLMGNTKLFSATDEYTFLYTVPTDRFAAIRKQLPDAAHQHKYAGVIARLNQLKSAYPLHVLLIFYQDHFIICATREQQLQLINTHYFDSGTAIIYHLLNVIRQLGGELSQTCVCLSGLIDGDSALYREIYKFVPIIDVDQLEGAAFLSQIEAYPSHFFVPFYKYI